MRAKDTTSYLAEPTVSPPLAGHSKLHLPEPPAHVGKRRQKVSVKIIYGTLMWVSVGLCVWADMQARGLTWAKLLIPTVPTPSSSTRIHSCLSVNLSAAKNNATKENNATKLEHTELPATDWSCSFPSKSPFRLTTRRNLHSRAAASSAPCPLLMLLLSYRTCHANMRLCNTLASGPYLLIIG